MSREGRGEAIAEDPSVRTGSGEADKHRFGRRDAMPVAEPACEARCPTWAERRELPSDDAAGLHDAAEKTVDTAIAVGVSEHSPRFCRVQQLVGDVDGGNQLSGCRPEVGIV